MTTTPGPRHAMVVARDPVLTGLRDGLASAGWIVAPIDTAEPAAASESSLGEAIAAAVAQGAPSLVVFADLHPAVAGARRVTDLDDEQWADGVERAFALARWVTRGVEDPLATTEGTLVWLVPSVGLMGATGHVAASTVAEGLRGWAKSLAKQWAARHVTVHSAAIALAHFTDSDVGFPEQVAALTGPAFGSVGDVVGDVAPAVAALSADGLHFLTGTTLVVDGGLYMGL